MIAVYVLGGSWLVFGIALLFIWGFAEAMSDSAPSNPGAGDWTAIIGLSFVLALIAAGLYSLLANAFGWPR